MMELHKTFPADVLTAVTTGGPTVWIENGSSHGSAAGAIQVRCAPDRLWEILAGYERHPDVIRVILKEKILRRAGHKTAVDMKCGLSVMAVRLGVDLEVDMLEQPPTRIDFNLIRGSIRHFAGFWHILPPDGHGKSKPRPSCVLLHGLEADVRSLGWFARVLLDRLPGSDSSIVGTVVSVILSDFKNYAERSER